MKMQLILYVTILFSALALTSAYPNKELIVKADSVIDKSGNVNIYKGNSTVITKHRYLVGILKNGSFNCAGSIISKTWVITAADCTKNVTSSNLTVVGSSKDGVTGVTYNVSQIVRHPDYGKDKMDYDFACIQITTHFYYWHKRMVRLPVSPPVDYEIMTAAGYGYTDSSYTSRSLSEISMTWLPKSSCKDAYKHFDFPWTDRMACAKNEDGAALCKGDFGDAFVVDGVVYGMFVGAGSTGFCTSSEMYAILADVYQVADWIQKTTGAEYANEDTV